MSRPSLSDATAMLSELVSRVESGTLSRLRRTAGESLHWQPDRDANSIGVTVRHYTR